MSELRECPFCGKEACYVDKDGNAVSDPSPDIACARTACMPPTSYVPADTWQSRPLEDTLRAELERVKAENEWIPTEEKYPELEEDVYVTNGIFYGVSGLYKDNNTGTFEWECNFEPTHWKPITSLPAAPEEGE